MRFEFDWDPAKAESNRRKHGVAFEDAMGVFADPLALSRLPFFAARPPPGGGARQYEEG